MPPRNKENKEVKSPRKGARVVEPDSDDEEYRRRRDRNNQVALHFNVQRNSFFSLYSSVKHVSCLLSLIGCHRFFQAVKRSRVKSRLRTQLTVERVNKLKTENELLQEKVKFLTKELGFLKDLFMAQASKSACKPTFHKFFILHHGSVAVQVNAFLFRSVSPNCCYNFSCFFMKFFVRAGHDFTFLGSYESESLEY